jgi:hypothetical protein
MSDWRDQEVRNEARSRDRNEWIGDVRGSMGDEVPTEMYVCECGYPACAEHIKLTRSEYPEIDQLVSEGGSFSVVQKIAGRPARIARQTDHRRFGARAVTP